MHRFAARNKHATNDVDVILKDWLTAFRILKRWQNAWYQQIIATKVLLGNRILYAEYDIDAMKNTNNMIRYDTRCYFNVRSKANMSQLNLPHGTDN